MDYKIKFEYSGAGKQSLATRQKVLQAQRGAEKQAGTGAAPAINKEILTSLKSLNSSIQKLTRAVEHSGGGGLGLGSGGGRGIGRDSAGIGGVGASLPLIGAMVATAGFTIQKVNQIGQAFIERTLAQKGNVGTAGFRFRQGMWNAAEMGSGMKSYATTSGKFAHNIKYGQEDQTAVNLGATFGLSPGEVFGQAGTFARAGAGYGRAAQQGAGMGIETELPVLMSGLSSILEEAVKAGINTSDMAKDIGDEISSLTTFTPGKSVDAALNIIKSFQNVKSQTEKGKMGETLEGLYAAGATKDILTKNITDQSEGGIEYRKRLVESGLISGKQFGALTNLGPNATYEDIQNAIGPAAAHTLFKNAAFEAGPEKLKMQTVRNIQKEFGSGAEGFQMFSTIADQLGWSDTQPQRLTSWRAAQSPAKDVSKKGFDTLMERYKETIGSHSGYGVVKAGMEEDLVFKHGAGFAEASLAMEKIMIDIADSTLPHVAGALKDLTGAVGIVVNACKDAAESLNQTFKENIKKDSPSYLFVPQ